MEQKRSESEGKHYHNQMLGNASVKRAVLGGGVVGCKSVRLDSGLARCRLQIFDCGHLYRTYSKSSTVAMFPQLLPSVRQYTLLSC